MSQQPPPAVLSPLDATISELQSGRSFRRTTDAQRQCIIEWLEQPGHFQLMTRSSAPASAPDSRSSSSASSPSRRSARARRGLKKADGYRSLMRHVNRCTQSRWTQQVARSRFESLLTSYKRAKALQQHQRQAQWSVHLDAGQLERKRALSMASCFVERIDALYAQLPADDSALDTIDFASDPSTPPPRDESDTTDARAPVEQAELVQLERERLALAQQQLRTRQLELELRAEELRAERETKRQSLRVELIARLVALGKTPAQVQQYLAVMNE